MQRTDKGSFNVALAGGLLAGRLITVADILPGATQLAYTIRPLQTVSNEMKSFKSANIDTYC